MKIVLCETNVKPRVLKAVSSDNTRAYDLVPSTIWNDSLCECKGFQYRGDCRHVRIAETERCRYWREWKGERDTNGDGDVGRCPECRHPLVVFEFEPEFE
jgi:hypothetical protein